jgi:hypothetical protein
MPSLEDRPGARSRADSTPGEARVVGRRLLDAITRLALRTENSASRLLEIVEDMRDQPATDVTVPPPRPPKRRGPPPVLPVATSLALDKTGRMTVVVAGLEYSVVWSPLRRDLVGILAEPGPATIARDGHLVGFKTVAHVVHALRQLGWCATRHSVVVEVGRVREALGSLNGALVETKRSTGYRFRLIRTAAGTATEV